MSKNEKIKIYLKVVLGLLVILGIAAFVLNVPGLQPLPLLIAGIVVVLAVVMIGHALKEFKYVKEGFPVEDEHSRKVKMIAKARAFSLSIWWMLILLCGVYVFELIDLDVEYALIAGILGMSVIFVISWVWAARSLPDSGCILRYMH
ncbi:MAG: hypothetical protein GQ533_06100 [Methanosarcinaceae archaeon]|jgi:Flp pilus assembly pilin Flp|nr:hypothetical protein [ANME-2 cluster archaeon]NOR47602.1 hypothetical protein [Methanosarcinaceae archaeon]